jgi:hypothetical protein
MTGRQKGAVVGLCAALFAAGFVAARLVEPHPSAAPPEAYGAAVRAALAEQDAVDRAERTAAALQQLGPENVAEAAAVYDRMINMLDEADIRPFASAWARFDPAGALDHALHWRFREKQQFGASAAIEGWAMQDPAAALQAYEETSANFPSLADDLFLNVLTGWLYSGEGGLVEYIADIRGHKQDIAIARVVAKLIRSSGTDATMSWVESIIGDDAYDITFKKRVFRRGIRMVGIWDPKLAAAWAMEHVNEPYAIDAPRIVAGRWASEDGRAAMEWVRKLPREEVPELAVREAFRGWLASDRAGAVAWLESEAPTAFDEPAIIFYAKDLSKREPDEAIGWCERLLDSKHRLHCLESAAAMWYQRDPDAAEKWLEQSPLDEEARRTARTPPEEIKQRKRRSRPGLPSG